MLWLTGLFFLTNAAHAAIRSYNVYAIAFVALAVTSYFYHAYPPTLLMTILDQIALWSVVLLGVLYWQQLPRAQRWIPLACITAAALLWAGGHATESFAGHADPSINMPAHGILHALSSMGHHAILAAL